MNWLWNKRKLLVWIFPINELLCYLLGYLCCHIVQLLYMAYEEKKNNIGKKKFTIKFLHYNEFFIFFYRHNKFLQHFHNKLNQINSYNKFGLYWHSLQLITKLLWKMYEDSLCSGVYKNVWGFLGSKGLIF